MESPVSAQAALLQALTEGRAFGVELAERVEKRTNGKIKVGPGRLYPALRSLEKAGLVESVEGEPLEVRRGRPRRYYKLTADGVRAANAQRVSIASLFRVVLGVAGRGV